MKAVSEETVDEAGHRDAMTLRLMEQRRDDGPRDDGHVVVRLCHQAYMPREMGPLRRSRRHRQDRIVTVGDVEPFPLSRYRPRV